MAAKTLRGNSINMMNPQKSIMDPNLPFANFFDPILATFRSFRSKKVSLEKRKTKWHDFIKEGNKSFIKETDDKTMILAVLYKL